VLTSQESHRISPPNWPSSKNAVGTKRLAGHAPETFSQNTSCRFLKNMHARGVLWEGWMGAWSVNRFVSTTFFEEGSMRWVNVVGFLWGKHWLEQGFYHSLTAFKLRSDNTPTYCINGVHYHNWKFLTYQWKSCHSRKRSDVEYLDGYTDKVYPSMHLDR